MENNVKNGSNSEDTQNLPDLPKTDYLENKVTTEAPVLVLSDAENDSLKDKKIHTTDNTAVVKNTPPPKVVVEPVVIDKPAKDKKRVSLTANFTIEEFEQIKKIIDWRIENKMTSTYDHFVRSCIDFSLNHGTQLQHFLTNLPEDNIGLFAYNSEVNIKPLETKGFFKK